MGPAFPIIWSYLVARLNWRVLCQCVVGPLFVIIEFAQYGNLRDYLRQYGTQDDRRGREPADADVVTSGDGKSLTHGDLLSFAVQVARGLQYLTSQLVSNEMPPLLSRPFFRLTVIVSFLLFQ